MSACRRADYYTIDLRRPQSLSQYLEDSLCIPQVEGEYITKTGHLRVDEGALILIARRGDNSMSMVQ